MSGAQEKQDDDDLEIEIDIVDDTPEGDRGRFTAPEATESDDDITVSDDEVSRYRDEVKKRIKDLSFKAHAERRAKEAAVREREEAARVAQHLHAEVTRLRQVAGNNEQIAFAQAKARAETQIESYKRIAKEAMEAGETDRFLDAQANLQRAIVEHERYAGYRPPPEEAPQPLPQFNKPQPVLDEKQKAFLARNPWFDADGDLEHEMTGYAFTMHDKLMRREGVSPQSEEYYRRIESAVRKRFPEYFNEKQSMARDATSAVPTVVAPAQRSGKATRQVRLSDTQVRVARRLGLTNEQYARQFAEDYPNG